MKRNPREFITIIIADLIIALFAFWLARYFGDLPRWYWLTLSALGWVAVGTLSGKLRFREYKRIRYAVMGIVGVDIITGIAFYLLYKWYVPGYEYDHSILLASLLIIGLELILYYVFRTFVYRKIPFFYEEPSLSEVVERGIPDGLDLSVEIWNQDIETLTTLIKEGENVEGVINKLQSTPLSKDTYLLDTTSPEVVLTEKVKAPTFVVYLQALNDVRHLNKLLAYTNYSLQDGGYIACHCATTAARKERILKQTPIGINYFILFSDYCWHRVVPKLAISKGFY